MSSCDLQQSYVWSFIMINFEHSCFVNFSDKFICFLAKLKASQIVILLLIHEW